MQNMVQIYQFKTTEIDNILGLMLFCENSLMAENFLMADYRQSYLSLYNMHGTVYTQKTKLIAIERCVI